MNSAQKIILQASRFLMSRVSFTKTVAMTTAVAFMVSTIIGPAAYAATTPVPGVAQTIKESLSAFQLPYSLGRVTDAKYLGSKKVVVAIQDLHCHPEVQRNISGILGILDDKYGKQQQFKVLVEGGMGPIDTSWLNKIADPKVRANAVEALMNAGRLTGAEYYAIQTKQNSLLQGLEDEKPYFENLARLNQIMDVRGDFAGRIGEFKAALAEVTNLYYTAGNRRLDKIAAKREARMLDTEKYYKILFKLAAREHIALYNFPATANFMEVMDQQRRLSYTAVNKQLTKFLETLKGKLPFNVYNQLVEKASRPNGIEDVYVILAKAAPGMDISQYPELAKFFRFVEINQKMNPIDLLKEERALLGELRGRLSRSRAEREVAFLADFLRYLQGYYENRMSAADYDYYTNHAQAFYELWGRYADARLLPSLDQYKDLFGKFYKTNVDRNRIFMEKIGAGDSSPASRSASASVEENIFLMSTQLSQMEPGTEVSVVVTGGFHTQGLAQMLEEQGISYVVITPSVTGGTEFAQRMYDLFARELSGQAVAQGKISRAISSRPANFSVDSYGLWLAASSDASLSGDALVSKARDMGLQAAVVQLAAQGMTAARIVEKLSEQNNAENLKTQLAGLGYQGPDLLNITAEGNQVVFRDPGKQFSLSITVSEETSQAEVAISIAADDTVPEVRSPASAVPSVHPDAGSAGIQLTHFENIRWVRYLESMGVPAPITRGLISIVEMSRFFTISIPNKHSFLAGQLWGLAAVVAVGLALSFLFMPVAPVLSAVAMTSAQFVTAVQSISLALLMIARPRMKSRGEMKGFVAAHQVGQVVTLPKITRLRTPGTSIINGVDIVESKDAVELIDMIIDESIDTLRAATLNSKINLVLDQLEAKLQTNASDPFTINSTIDLYGQLVAAVKENDDGIDAAVDAIMPSFTVKKRLTAVWMGATVILGLVTGIPLNMFFVQYLVYSFAFLKALPIISNLYQHSRFNRNSTGIVFTAGPARPGRGSSLPVDRQVAEDIGVKIGLPGMQLKRLWDAVEALRAGQVDDLRQAIPDLFKAAAEVDPAGEFNLISDITKLRDALNNRDGINDTGRQELIETLENKLWAVISLQFWPLMSTRLENAFLARNEQLGLLSKLFHNQAAAIFTIEDANSALEKRKELLKAALVRAKDELSRAQSGNNIRANIVKTIVENNLNRVLDALVRIESMTDQDRDQALDLVVERAPQEFVAIVLENFTQSVPGNNIPGVSVLRLMQSNLDQATGELELLRSISLMFAESDRQLDAVVLSLAEMHRWYNLSSTLLFDMGKVLASTTWRSFTPSGFSSLILPNNQERVEQWRAAGVPEFVIGLRVGALELLQTLNPRFVRKHYTRVATAEEMNDRKAGTSLPAGVVTPGSVAARYAGQAVILGAMAAVTVSTMALFGFNIGIISSMAAVAAGIAGNIVTHAVYNVFMPHAPLTLDGGAATADAEHGVNAALSATMGTGFDPILSAVTAMPVTAQDRRTVLALIQELVTQERLRPGPMAGNMHTYVLSSEPGKQTHYDNPLELFQGILAVSKLSQKQRSKIANAFMQAAIQSDQKALTVFTHLFRQFDKMQERQLEAGARLEQLEYNELRRRALSALATIALRHACGEIDPDVSIRVSQDVAEIAPVAREVKVGIYALAGNPMHWAHILIPFEAIAAGGLDKVIFVLSGPDSRKPVLAGTAKYRFKMATTFVNDVFDGFAQVSPIAREINDGADGETNIFRILDLNSRQKINAYYMVGGDHYAVSVVRNGVETPDTIGKLLTNLASYRDVRSPGYNPGRENHVVSAIFIGRSGEIMDPAVAGDEAARRNMSFDVRFLEGFETDMSSTRIRKALRDGDVPALSILPYKKFRYIQKHPMFQLMITGLPVDGEEYSFEGLVDVQDHREISEFVNANGKRVFVTEAPRAGKAGKKTAPGIEYGATPDRQIEVNGQEFYIYDEASFESAISARQAMLDERQVGLLNQSLTGNDVALTLQWTKKHVMTPLDTFLKRFTWITPAARQWIVDVAVGVVEYPVSLLGPLFGVMHFKTGDTLKDRVGLVVGGSALLAVSVAMMSAFGFAVTPASFFAAWGINAITHVILNRLFRQAGMRELTMGLDDDYRGLDDADDEYDRLLQLLHRLPTRKAEIVQELAQRSANAASYLAGVRITAEDVDTVRLAAIARIERELAETPAAAHGEIDRYNMRRVLVKRQLARLQTLSVRGSDVSQEHIRTLLQLAPVELLDQVLTTKTIPEMHAKRIRNEQEIYSLLAQEFAMLDEIFISLQEPGWSEKIDTPIHAGRPTLRKLHADIVSLQRLYKDHQPGIDGLRPAQALYADIEGPAPESQQMNRSVSLETLAFPSWAVMLHPFIVPQTLTVAVGTFLKNPIDYTVLGKGVHAVVVPRTTFEILNRAIMRATLTGATVVIVGSIDASEQSDYRPINGSGYLFREITDMSKGKVVEIVFVRDTETDDRLMKDALTIVDTFSGDQIVCAQVDPALAAITDFRNGLKISVLELGYRNPDTVIFNTFMSHMVTKPVVVMAVDARGEDGDIDTDGELWPAQTQADFVAQMHWLDDRTLYKNTTYVQPVSAVAAISPNQIVQASDVVAMITDDRAMANLKHGNIDTLFLDVAPEAWQDAAVLLQLRRLIDKLSTNGIRVGFYENIDGKGSRSLGRYNAMGQIAGKRNGDEVILYLRTAQQNVHVRDMQRLVSRSIPGVKMLLEDPSGIRDLSAAPGAAGSSYLLASEQILLNTSPVKLENSMRNARMVILDAPVTRQVQSDGIQHETSEIKNRWQGLFAAFRQNMERTPSFAMAQGRSDARRAEIRPVYRRSFKDVEVAIEQALGDPKAADALHEAMRPGATEDGMIANARNLPAGIWGDDVLNQQNPVMDAAYRIGFVGGIIESIFAREDIIVDESPVILSPSVRQQYASARMRQWLLRVADQPANPLQDLEMINGIDDQDNLPNYRTDIPGLPRMTVHDATIGAQRMVDVLARIARSSSDENQQRYALAGIIELLRLYGDRDIPENLIEQTNDVVKTELIRTLLGAA